MSGKDDGMAYGHYPGGGGDESQRASEGGSGGSTRAFLGDTMRMFRDKYKEHQQASQGQQQQQQQQPYNPQASGGAGQQQYQQGYPGGPPPSHGYPQPPPGQQGQQQQQGQYGHGHGHGQGQDQGQQQQSSSSKPSFVSGLLGKAQSIGSDIAQQIGSNLDPQAYATYGPSTTHGSGADSKTRFGSFAPERQHNDAKWYVDGCDYMWAVSRALESAKESIWILDWWLSPELYLRRPPAKNEQYRLDRMLQAAAQRGVKVNVIVYKEVTQALSLSSSHTKHHLEDLHANIAVFRHPDHLPDRQGLQDSIVSSLQNFTLNAAGLTKLSGDAIKGVYGMSDGVILYWAHHEKLCIVDSRMAFMGGLDLCYGRWDTHQHAIADMHPEDARNTLIPGQDYNNARILDFENVVHWERNKLDRNEYPRMGWSDVSLSLKGPAVEDLRRHFVERWNFIYDGKYQSRNDTRYARLVLYQRPLSAHQQQQQQQGQQQQGQQHGTSPQPGGSPQPTGGYPAPPPQGTTPQQSSGAQQPQWNTGGQSQPAPAGQPYFPPPPTQQKNTPHQSGGPQQPQWSTGNQPQPTSTTPSGGQTQQPGSGQPYFPPPPTQGDSQSQSQEPSHSQTRGFDDGLEEQSRAGFGRGGGSSGGGLGSELRGLRGEVSNFGRVLRGQLAGQVHQYQDKYFSGPPGQGGHGAGGLRGHMSCQIVRSSSKWSHGLTQTESSIQAAYATVIRESEHFVYIENQFFITATSHNDKQAPVQNLIGAAIVERIIRAARNNQKWKMMVVIPAVPGFAGDLRDDSSLGTRAIMEFQYNSINRGGNSILECVAREGINPMEYIRFYNLRNYDRIRAAPMEQRQQQQRFEAAATSPSAGGQTMSVFDTTTTYTPVPHHQQQQQSAAQPMVQGGRWNSVAECYMLNGEDIRKVPSLGEETEIDAFVSEELYVHSKVLIADDRTVICGSANLNDRSQLGSHDSEIAIVIQDPDAIQSRMNGQEWPVSRYAATLRRQLCRKHLGLLPAQNCEVPEGASREPVDLQPRIEYDLGSREDMMVADPVSDEFQNLWNSRANTNTGVYRRVFHAVPDDTVRNWNDYKEFYEYNFHASRTDNNGGEDEEKQKTSPRGKYKVGHVVADEFPAGAEGARAVREALATVQGSVVEMPLMFLAEEDIAQEGLSLNSLTQEVYT